MNWAEHERPEIAGLIDYWQRVGQFRARHPAIGAGTHRLLSSGQPYAFARTLGDDRIVVVQAGASLTPECPVPGRSPGRSRLAWSPQ